MAKATDKPYVKRRLAGHLLLLFRHHGGLQYLMLDPDAHWIWRKLELNWPRPRIISRYREKGRLSQKISVADVSEVENEFRSITASPRTTPS